MQYTKNRFQFILGNSNSVPNYCPLAGGGLLAGGTHEAPPGVSSSVSLATSRCHSIGLGGRVPGCPEAIRNALCVGVRQAVLEVGVPRGVGPAACGVVGRGQPESKANAAKGLGAKGLGTVDK